MEICAVLTPATLIPISVVGVEPNWDAPLDQIYETNLQKLDLKLFMDRSHLTTLELAKHKLAVLWLLHMTHWLPNCLVISLHDQQSSQLLLKSANWQHSKQLISTLTADMHLELYMILAYSGNKDNFSTSSGNTIACHGKMFQNCLMLFRCLKLWPFVNMMFTLNTENQPLGITHQYNSSTSPKPTY